MLLLFQIITRPREAMGGESQNHVTVGWQGIVLL